MERLVVCAPKVFPNDTTAEDVLSADEIPFNTSGVA